MKPRYPGERINKDISTGRPASSIGQSLAITLRKTTAEPTMKIRYFTWDRCGVSGMARRSIRHQAAEFADPSLGALFVELATLEIAIGDAISDLNNTARDGSLLYLDWANAYPSITPRGTVSPVKNKHDYFCQQTMDNLLQYKNIAGFVMSVCPLFFIEMWDTLDHRRQFINAVLDQPDLTLARRAIVNSLKKMPKSSDDIEKEVAGIITWIGSSTIRAQLAHFNTLVRADCIRPLFKDYDELEFYDCLRDIDRFTVIRDNIDHFRRPSTSRDTADTELHRDLDVLRVMAVSHLHNRRNDKRLVYYGTDKLREIFPDKQKSDLTRMALTPHLILRSLAESPSDRDTKREAITNLHHYLKMVITACDALYDGRKSQVLPWAVAQTVKFVENSTDNLIFGRGGMMKTEEYEELVSRLTDRKASIKEAFERARYDVNEAAAELTKEITSYRIFDNAHELIALFPNERLRQILDEMQGP